MTYRFCLALLALALPAAAGVVPGDLRCEYRVDPLGVDETAPRLSWTLASDERGQVQTAFQIRVASSREALLAGRADLWNTGKVAGRRAVHIPYLGKPLASGQRAWWQVRAWDRAGVPSAFSPPASWEMGLLKPSDWARSHWISLAPTAPPDALDLEGARWIWFPEGDPAAEAPAGTRWFRKTVDLPAGITRARFVLTADDQFRLFVNGKDAGRSDGSTDAWRQARALDVTRHLVPGRNVLAIAATNTAGPAALAGRLRVEVGEGKPLVVETDASWKSAAAEQRGWQAPGFDDTAWQPAREVARMGEGPWGAVAVAPEQAGPAPYLRKPFRLEQPVRRARLYATALGWYRLLLNGHRVGNDVLAPGWTDYRKRAENQVYDVTALLRPGENVLGGIVGGGWWAGPLGWGNNRNPFGPGPARLRAQLHLELADGSTRVLGTDGAWRASAGPILSAELYAGEEYDARREQPGWDRPGFDDRHWQPAMVLDQLQPLLVAERAEGIRVTETLPARQLTEPAPGVYVFDLGQNMVGWARLKVSGPAGTKVTLRFAEELKPDGNVYRENLRGARATDTYVLKGQGAEVFEPHFTYHGFRYVEVTGCPAKPGLDAITGRVFHSAMPVAGRFECSSPMLNQLFRNITWGQRGNLMSVPTDCPQRDERLGWMGDAQIFARTSCFYQEMAGFYSKWMQDIVDAQGPEGGFSDVSPRVVAMGECSPAWAEAGLVIPWTLYQVYGDTRLLARHFDAMKRYVDLIHRRNPNLLWVNGRGSDYGDWVPAGGKTPKEVIAGAYFAYDARLLSRTARAVGRTADAEHYGKLADDIAAAFNREYLDAEGRYRGDSQTAYAMALALDLAPREQRDPVGRRLVEAVERANGHLSTGFIGTAMLLPALTDTGHLDVAYRVLNHTTYPSWGYMVEKGATTIWELWNSDTAGPGMNSRNHFCFGAVGEWLQRYLAGIEIDPEAPGYERIIVQPHPGGGLTRAAAEYQSVRGPIRSAWRVSEGGLTLSFALPANTTARVRVPLPAGRAAVITEGGRPVWRDEAFVPGVPGIAAARRVGDAVVLEVGSGSYEVRVAGVSGR